MIFLFATILCNQLAANRPSETFFQGSLEEAKAIAEKTGKHILVDFYAQWCAPCKWMEETSFADQQVKNILEDKYISVKINIDEFEGYNLKQQYEIRYLPTILIFNKKGKIIERVEETMSPLKLRSLLTENSLGLKVHESKKINASPKRRKLVKTTRPAISTIKNKTINKSSYRVQLGVYTDFKKAFRQVNELKKIFLEPIIVLNGIKKQKTIYKIMIGEFKTKSEADSFAKILEIDFKLKGIVN